jgi:hypothetical protein
MVIGGEATGKHESTASPRDKSVDAYASFKRLACSGSNIPSVVHTSIPIPLTSRTMVKIRSNPRFRPARSLQAAPIQNLVLPFSLA